MVIPAGTGMREALGRRLAIAEAREARLALVRMGAREDVVIKQNPSGLRLPVRNGADLDDVLAAALREAADPVPILRLAARFGNPALAGVSGAGPIRIPASGASPPA